MVQTIRPISDISTGSWTDEGSSFNDGSLYTSIQETSQDGDTSRAEGASGAGTFEVKLDTATDPVSSVSHTVKAWGKGVGSGGGEKVDVFLYQGTTLIATLANNWTPGRGSYAEGVWTISGAEADNITDYADLRVRIVEDTIGGGSERFNVTQIYMEVPDAPAVLTQTKFRFRYDTVGLNSGTFDFALNVDPTIDSEVNVRLRAEVSSDGADTDTYKLQYNWNSLGWFDVSDAGTPPVNPVTPVHYRNGTNYADNDATTDVFTGGTFVAGEGLENNPTGSITLAAGERTELEFCFVIRKLFGDDENTNIHGFTAQGHTIDFRVVKGDNTLLTYTQVPTATVNHPTGLIGGTFPETTGQIIAVDPDGIIYAVVEHAQLPVPIIPAMLKSTDGGDSWVPQDDTDWTSTHNELEALDFHYVAADDTIYMGWQINDDVAYREFLDSTEATNPDTYVAAVQSVATPTAVVDQAVAIAKRSDGTVVMFYSGIATDNKLFYKIRSSGGTWGSEQTLEGETSIDWTGVQCVIGASDLIHIIYSNKGATGTDGEIYYRNLNSSGTLSSRTSVLTSTDTNPDHSPLLKPVYWDDGGTEKIYLIYYKPSDGKLYSRIVTSGSVGAEVIVTDNAVISDRASSGQPSASAVVDGKDVYVVYSHETDLDIYLTKSVNGGTFDTDTEILNNVTCGLLSALVFTHNSDNGSAKVIGMIYDDERDGEGNTGGTVYFEHEISAGGTTHNEALALAVSNRTTVPVTTLTRVGAIPLAVSNRTVVPVTSLFRVGAVSLAVFDRTVVPTTLIDFIRSVTLARDAGISFIGNIITPQTMATLNRIATLSVDAGLAYVVDIALGKDKGISLVGALTRVGLVTLGTKDLGISISAQHDVVDAISLAEDLGITFIGNIDTPQGVTLGTKDLGIVLLGNIDTPQSVTLSNTRAIAFVGGLVYATNITLVKDLGISVIMSLVASTALSLNRTAGETLAVFLERVGAVTLNNIKTHTTSSQLDVVASLTFPKVITLAVGGNIVANESVSFARDLGLSESALVEFNTVLSFAKEVTFIATAEIPGEINVPNITGDITLIENAAGFVDLLEQAAGTLVLVETSTGTIILDLTQE